MHKPRPRAGFIAINTTDFILNPAAISVTIDMYPLCTQIDIRSDVRE